MGLREDAWLAEITDACQQIDATVSYKEDRGEYTSWVFVFAKLGPTDAHRRHAKKVAKAFQRRWAQMGVTWMVRYNAPNQQLAQRFFEWANSPQCGPRSAADYTQRAELAQAGNLTFRIG